MKIALITVVLFLLSYVAVNGGLGDNPFELAVPLLVVVATTLGARWVMGRGKRAGRMPAVAMLDPPLDAPPCPPSRSPVPPSPSREGNGKARKLF
jgi:hypothetical protein